MKPRYLPRQSQVSSHEELPRTPGTGEGSTTDPEMAQFFDSLIWDEWQPTKDPSTRIIPIRVKSSITPSQSDLGSPEFLPDRLMLDRCWPLLSSEARQAILEILRTALSDTRPDSGPG
jgi:hypothetical protein